MSASRRGCKRQVVISEWRRGAAVREVSAPLRKMTVRGARGLEEGGPMTSPATLSTDLGQRVARFIYIHARERRGAFLFTRAPERASARAEN